MRIQHFPIQKIRKRKKENEKRKFLFLFHLEEPRIPPPPPPTSSPPRKKKYAAFHSVEVKEGGESEVSISQDIEPRSSGLSLVPKIR